MNTALLTTWIVIVLLALSLFKSVAATVIWCVPASEIVGVQLKYPLVSMSLFDTLDPEKESLKLYVGLEKPLADAANDIVCPGGTPAEDEMS